MTQGRAKITEALAMVDAIIHWRFSACAFKIVHVTFVSVFFKVNMAAVFRTMLDPPSMTDTSIKRGSSILRLINSLHLIGNKIDMALCRAKLTTVYISTDSDKISMALVTWQM